MPANTLKSRGMASRDDATFGPREARVLYATLTEELCMHLDATRLIELGARAGLVCQLTGLDRSAVSRLFQSTLGRTSPAGQLPFTDAWYRRNDRRMLHAAVVWRLHRRFIATEGRAARVLICCYETYLAHVSEPVLCLTRASFVPRLVTSGVWVERRCPECSVPYLKCRYDLPRVCPGCRWYARTRLRRKRTSVPKAPVLSPTTPK